MASKTQMYVETAPVVADFEGAITSSNIPRLDEVILKNYGSNPLIHISLFSGKTIEFPLHISSEDEKIATLVIPEKYYKEAAKCQDLRDFLEVFDNQRYVDVELRETEYEVIIEPVNSKRGKFRMTFIR